MPRTLFDRDLQALQNQILQLGSEVEENLITAVTTLQQFDARTARMLIHADEDINAARIKIGLDALTLIATQQPFAGDMRRIAAIIEIVGELERIHDYVKGIAKISLMLQETPINPALLRDFSPMAEKSREMLHNSLTAFAERDAALARQIPPEDDVVDELYNQIYLQLLQAIMQKPEMVEQVNTLSWALHNLERAADRVINICEWVVYMVEGVYREMDSELEAPPFVGR
ncbi:MAG: phosphate signaling complex protein PhoU [Ardenticatenaceae bacterium]|nr:phosphate signaling complex protein PhoU [Anaerolineales bacterium]MCB8922111.1 phosphate signaling complex protein PhoU [Ardenticatenaceae bacterium]MCB9003227.1 phosphate signaling complex protein PhoU [Ardenticatenaceae bacterium]